MSQSTKTSRLNYIDHARGLVIALVVLQHAVQIYASQWGGRLYFVAAPDQDRSRIYDVLFMWTDGFIMQALFFIAGLFVLPSLYHRGWLNFIKAKLVRLGIPMVFGIIFLTAPLRYLKYEENEEPGIGYFDYWFNIFLEPENITAAGYWFIGVLLVFTFIAAFIDTILPFIKNWLGHLSQWLCRHPVIGYLIVGGIAAVLIGVSDIIWGTYWWINMGKPFNLSPNSFWHYLFTPLSARANMFCSYIFFFILGIGFSRTNLFSNKEFMDKVSRSLFAWVILLILLTIAYGWYNQAYLETGAFSNEVPIHFYRGGTWGDAWPLIASVAPGILIRTTIHGFLCTAQIITLILFLYRYTNYNTGLWWSLGICSYGIYLFHEPIVVYAAYFLFDFGLPSWLSVLINFAIGLSISWGLTYFLKRTPVIKKII